VRPLLQMNCSPLAASAAQSAKAIYELVIGLAPNWTQCGELDRKAREVLVALQPFAALSSAIIDAHQPASTLGNLNVLLTTVDKFARYLAQSTIQGPDEGLNGRILLCVDKLEIIVNVIKEIKDRCCAHATMLEAFAITDGEGEGHGPDMQVSKGVTDSMVPDESQLCPAVRKEGCRDPEHSTTFDSSAASTSGAIRLHVQQLRTGTESTKQAATVSWRQLVLDHDTTSVLAEVGDLAWWVELLRNSTDDVRDVAARAVRRLKFDENFSPLVGAGFIPLLVGLLSVGCEQSKIMAAVALENLALSGSMLAIYSQGVIYSLKEQLREGSEGVTEAVARALGNLATDTGSRKSITAAGAIPLLVQLLREGAEGAKEQAVGALDNLAGDAQTIKAITSAGAIPLLVQRLEGGTDTAKLQAVRTLDKLADYAANRKPIIEATAVPLLVQLLSVGSEALKAAAALTLANLSVYNSEPIAEAGAIPPLVQLLTADMEGAKEAAAVALCCLADDAKYRKAILAAGATPLLVRLLLMGSVDTQGIAADVLCRVVAGNRKGDEAIIAAGAHTVLAHLLLVGSLYAKEQAATLLYRLTDAEENMETIQAARVIPLLVQLLRDGTEGAKEAAAGVLGNLATVNEENRTTIAQAGAIPLLVRLLRIGSPLVKEKAIRTLFNLTFAETIMETIARAGIIPLLVQLLTDGTDDAKEAAAAMLHHLALDYGDDEAISDSGALPLLVQLIPLLLQLLKTGTDQARNRSACALYDLVIQSRAGLKIFKAENPARVLKWLQRHGSEDVQETTAELLDMLNCW
jgi:vacuolar protein 8